MATSTAGALATTAATHSTAEPRVQRPDGPARTICARANRPHARRSPASRPRGASTAEPSATAAATRSIAARTARLPAAAGCAAARTCAWAIRPASRLLAWRRAGTVTAGRSGTAVAGRSSAARPVPRTAGCVTKGYARQGQTPAACRKPAPRRLGTSTAVTLGTGVDQLSTAELPARKTAGPARTICARQGQPPAARRWPAQPQTATSTAATSAMGADQRHTAQPPARRTAGPARTICARQGRPLAARHWPAQPPTATSTAASIGDGCGNSLDCGTTCDKSGWTCQNNLCKAGPTAGCTPLTCKPGLGRPVLRQHRRRLRQLARLQHGLLGCGQRLAVRQQECVRGRD